jgi:hypothetical protein
VRQAFSVRTMNKDEAFVQVWQQALVEDAPRVALGDSSYHVGRTKRNGLKQIDFDFGDQEYCGIEQNPLTKSRWAKLAREGKKIMQFVHENRYVAVVVDGQYEPYLRGKSR